ncbi:hypothetical protein CMV30_16810 [Nibricoccus aquaticus]|uniref:TVP38/TMEM64 family membrane protein n=2 Tax=Nibricoccus aquaticus TaxID=2576891 RepID=A0A290QLT9_9BACT|nr:hypothetical protein CMV30_16810 [Nibricoccus aquaticus]
MIVVGFGLFAKFGGHYWKEAITGLPVPVLLLCLVVLPLTGFPVSLMLVAVGARFGFWQGLAAAAAAIPIHLALSYPLSGLFRRPITAMVTKAGWSLPKLDRETAWPFTTWLAFVPGVSYTLKNYTPPLAGVPFRIYFLAFYPVHLCTAVLGLLIGGATMHFSWLLAVGIVTYGIAIGILTKVLANRLRAKGAWVSDSSADGMQAKFAST